MAVLRLVVLPARLALVAMALSAALDGALGRELVELPQPLLLVLVPELGLLLQLLPEELRDELNEEEELRDELNEEERPPPLEPRAKPSSAGVTRASESNSAMRK